MPILKKLHSITQNCYNRDDDRIIDVLYLVNAFLSAIPNVSSIRVDRPKNCDKMDIEITINRRYSYVHKFRRDIFRTCLASFAYLCHKKLGVAFMPYGGSLNIVLPFDDTETKRLYHVVFMNTGFDAKDGSENWIEFTHCPCPVLVRSPENEDSEIKTSLKSQEDSDSVEAKSE